MYSVIEHPSGRTLRRLADNADIPEDPANTDYQRYLEWVAAGGIPEPWPTS